MVICLALLLYVDKNAWVTGVITEEQKGEGQIDTTLCDHLPRHCLMSSQSTPTSDPG